MAVYANVPDVPMAKKSTRKPTRRSQRPGYAHDEPMGFAETPPSKSNKTEKPVSKRQREAASNRLDKGNKDSKVAGNGGSRANLAQGARKASNQAPKPNPTDKKVRGKAQK